MIWKKRETKGRQIDDKGIITLEENDKGQACHGGWPISVTFEGMIVNSGEAEEEREGKGHFGFQLGYLNQW